MSRENDAESSVADGVGLGDGAGGDHHTAYSCYSPLVLLTTLTCRPLHLPTAHCALLVLLVILVLLVLLLLLLGRLTSRTTYYSPI